MSDEDELILPGTAPSSPTKPPTRHRRGSREDLDVLWTDRSVPRAEAALPPPVRRLELGDDVAAAKKAGLSSRLVVVAVACVGTVLAFALVTLIIGATAGSSSHTAPKASSPHAIGSINFDVTSATAAAPFADASTWAQIYASLGGSQWAGAASQCPQLATAPCGCSYSPRASAAVEVVCTSDGNYITQIRLVNSNAVGVLSSAVVSSLSHLTLLQIAGGNVVSDGSWFQGSSGPCLSAPQCDSGLAVCILPVPLCSATGLGAWQALYDATGGNSTWSSCRESRNDACSCGAVECTYERSVYPSGLGSLNLENMNLSGVLPTDALTNDAGKLSLFSILHNPDLSVPNDYPPFDCVNLPACDSGAWGVCQSPWDICGTTSDLAVWFQIWDQVQPSFVGTAAENCTRFEPCSTCSGVVSCQDKHITKIDLSTVNHTSGSLTSDLVKQLTQIQVLDLSTVTLAPSLTCITQQANCVNGTATCIGSFCPITEPDDPAAGDKKAWQLLFTSLNGYAWDDCYDSVTDPCKYCQPPRLVCNSIGLITEIRLNRNGLTGLLGDQILPQFQHAEVIDLSNFGTTGSYNEFTLVRDITPYSPFVTAQAPPLQPPCYTLAYCQQPGVYCDLGTIPLCSDIPSVSPTQAPSTPMPTANPTGEITLAASDLAAWQALFIQLGGAKWVDCADAFTSPCTCGANNASQIHSVQCLVIQGQLRITQLILAQNHVVGAIWGNLFRAFTALNVLEMYNLGAGNGASANKLSILQHGLNCLNLQPECSTTILCDFKNSGIQVCAKGTSGSSAPTSAAPVPPPTTSVPTTVAPTNMPTSTAQPTGPPVCSTDGGYVPGETLCASSFFVDGQGPFTSCLSITAVPPYVDPLNPPLAPVLPTTSNQLWCPTVAYYRSYVPQRAGEPITREMWGYCSCQAAPTQRPTTVSPGAPTSPPQQVVPQAPTPPTVPVLSLTDLYAWQQVYDTLEGPDWIHCGDRNFPCAQTNCGQTYSRVQCGVVNGAIRILSIVLRNNAMVGPMPDAAFAAMDALQVLDLSNNNKLPNKNIINAVGPCLQLGFCLDPSVSCNFANSGLLPYAQCATNSPTSTWVTPGDLQVWQALWSSTSGNLWVSCNNYNDPCNACPPSAGLAQSVNCDVVNGTKRIVSVILPNNNLKGYVPNLSSWGALQSLDFSSSSKSKTPNVLQGCVNSLQCAPAGPAQCSLQGSGVAMCSTPAPSAAHTYVLDAQAWVLFQQSLNPSGWIDCGTTTDPCNDCPTRVTCEDVAGFNGQLRRIVGIDLANNAVRGTLPDASALFVNNGLSMLQVLQLSNRVGVTKQQANALLPPPGTPSGSCVSYPPCLLPNAVCLAKGAGVSFCTASSSSAPTSNPTGTSIQSSTHAPTHHPSPPTTTNKPTLSPVSPTLPPLMQSNLVAWQALYDAMKGWTWRLCSGARDNPCSCGYVVDCQFVGPQYEIVGLKLNNINLNGLFPASALNALTGLQFLDISSYPNHVFNNSVTNTQCLNVGVCGVTAECLAVGLSQGFCGVSPQGGTDAPSKSPTIVTGSPTPKVVKSPTRHAGSTSAPQTSSPQSFAPTTAAPHAAGRPSTLKPTTSEPTTAEPTTAEPTTAEPTTLQPNTDSPTHRPSGTRPTTKTPSTAQPTPKAVKSPTRHVASTSAPLTSAPHTSAPHSSAPTSAAPHAAGKPTSKKPTTSEPTTSEPTTSEPTTSEPTTSEPTTSEPTTLQPTSQPTAHPLKATKSPSGKKTTTTKSPSSMPTAPITGSPSLSQAPTSSSVLSAVDLVVYELFFDAMRGQDWLICADSRANPCACQVSNTIQVECTVVQGQLHITAIVMEDNHLVGYLPAALSQLAYLQVLDVSTFSPQASVANLFYNTACVTIPQCSRGDAICILENSGLNLCSATATSSPTPGLAAQDADAFAALYDATQGVGGWTNCSTARNDPCNSITNGCLAGSTVDAITCGKVSGELRITGIALENSRMRGYLNETVIGRLSALTLFDVSSAFGSPSANVFFNLGCIKLPQCYKGVKCVFTGSGASVCPVQG